MLHAPQSRRYVEGSCDGCRTMLVSKTSVMLVQDLERM
jgi:hypothetical protein